MPDDNGDPFVPRSGESDSDFAARVHMDAPYADHLYWAGKRLFDHHDQDQPVLTAIAETLAALVKATGEQTKAIRELTELLRDSGKFSPDHFG